jgi:hypothetical protein
MGIVKMRLEEVHSSLQREIGKDRPDYEFGMSEAGFVPDSLLGYKSNTEEYSKGYRLNIKRQDYSTVRVNAPAIGSKFRGLIGIAVAVQLPGLRFELASKESFQVNYAEQYESIERGFRTWLEESLLNALTIWRKSL